MPRTARIKPPKPYPSYPLTAHPNGQWCKKIRGKVHFFGVWTHPDAALRRYHAVAGDLHGGRQCARTRVSGDGLTVKDACNEFLGWQKDKLDVGEIGYRWFEDCRTILGDFAESVGKQYAAEDLRPEDFQRYRARLAKRLGVHALTRYITTVKSVLRYAYESDLIREPVKFGKNFSPPSASQKRRARARADAETGKKLFSRDELMGILEGSCPMMKAAVLLGMNGGFGNTDCASLPLSAIDGDAGVIDYDRPKTGVRRTVPLWTETAQALDTVLGIDRPEPADEETAKLALLTPAGRPVVRQIVSVSEGREPDKISRLDLLSREFTALLKSLGMYRRGIGFYTLRHTFRTWADETHDQHAIHRIMGHALPGMRGVYVEEIELSRLRRVVEHVREKLLT